MWEQCRKRALVTEICIVGFCAVAVYSGRFNWPTIIAMFVVMQIGFVLGSYWGARIQKQAEAADRKLPLEDKL
jgi:hypothetical protein